MIINQEWFLNSIIVLLGQQNEFVFWNNHQLAKSTLSKLFSRAGYDGGRIVFNVNKKNCRTCLVENLFRHKQLRKKKCNETRNVKKQLLATHKGQKWTTVDQWGELHTLCQKICNNVESIRGHGRNELRLQITQHANY